MCVCVCVSERETERERERESFRDLKVNWAKDGVQRVLCKKVVALL